MSNLIDRDRLIGELILSHASHAATLRETVLLDRDVRIVREQPIVKDVPKNKVKKQKVVRTVPTTKGYWYDEEKMKYLRDALNDGYTVVMCNKIGEDLEYILEKEYELVADGGEDD